MGWLGKCAMAALLALAVAPAGAQTPSGAMPPGTQNPATAQPQLVAPATPQLTQPTPPAGPPPQPAAPGGMTPPSALIIPGGAGGLCECLINHDPNLPPFDKTKMHQVCLGSVEACQSACNTQRYYSFVPHAIFTCPAGPGEPGAGHIASGPRSPLRLASTR